MGLLDGFKKIVSGGGAINSIESQLITENDKAIKVTSFTLSYKLLHYCSLEASNVYKVEWIKCMKAVVNYCKLAY